MSLNSCMNFSSGVAIGMVSPSDWIFPLSRKETRLAPTAPDACLQFCVGGALNRVVGFCDDDPDSLDGVVLDPFRAPALLDRLYVSGPVGRPHAQHVLARLGVPREGP